MKKSNFFVGTRKLLTLSLVLGFMCFAVACDNDTTTGNNGSMAGNGSQPGSGTAGNNSNVNSVTNGSAAMRAQFCP